MRRNFLTKRNIYIYFSLLSFSVIFAIILASMYSVPSGNVQVISIIGPISSNTDVFSGGTSSTEVIASIDAAESNANVKAILLEINSPGGTVVGSAEIVERIKSANKPVISWIREAGASGAYWVASASDAIVAHNLSITGSVGVTGSYLEFSEIMEKYGVDYVDLSIPDNKEIGSQFRNITEEERAILDNILEETYGYFLKDAAAGRNMTLEDFREKTNKGTIMLGSKAYELGLIDYLGGKETAINVTKQLANITEVQIIESRKEFTLLDLISSVKNNYLIKNFFSINA